MINGYKENTGEFEANPKFASKPQPGSNPQAAANVKLGIEKQLPIGIRNPKDLPVSTNKTKVSVRPEEEPLERIKKREPGAIIDKDKERRDNERMQKAVELANASETLLKGKEKRKVAKYDRQDGRNSDESKLKRRTGATEVVQALGSLLKDIGKPTSKVKKAGVAAETPEEKPKTKTPLTIDNKKNKITANIVEFQKK